MDLGKSQESSADKSENTKESRCIYSDPLTILATVSSQHRHESVTEQAVSTSDAAPDKIESSIKDILSKAPDEKPYVCAICLKGYDNPKHLRNHEQSHTGEKQYQCDECGRQFCSKGGLEYHKESHLKHSVFCEVCRKGFTTQKRLNEHAKIHVKEREFVCDICGKSFKNSQGLHAHIKLHTGQLRFACDFCDRKFPGRNALEAHKRTHSGEKPFVCDTCGASFRTKGTLQGHQRTHKEDAPYVCKVCGRGFKRKDGLEGHAQIHEPPGTFTCDICGNAYSRLAGLKAHKRTHTKHHQLHTCEYCGKIFTRKDNLGVHRRIHTKELAHQCSVCGKLFTHKCRLDKHMKEAHGQVDEIVSSQPVNTHKKINPSKSSAKKTKKKTAETNKLIEPAMPESDNGQIWQPNSVQDYGNHNQFTWSHYPTQDGYVGGYCYPNNYQQDAYNHQFLQSSEASQERAHMGENQGHNIPMPHPVSHVTPSSDLYHTPMLSESNSGKFPQYDDGLGTTANDIPANAYSLSSAYLSSTCIQSVAVASGMPLNEIVQTQASAPDSNQLPTSLPSILSTIPPPPASYPSSSMCNDLAYMYGAPSVPNTHCEMPPVTDVIIQEPAASPPIIPPDNLVTGSCDIPTYPSDMLRADMEPQIIGVTTGDNKQSDAEKPQNIHSCASCKLYFTSYLQLSLHQRVHQDKFRPFKCWTCLKQFRSRISLQTHRRTVHSGHVPLFSCDKCERKFKTKRLLEDHAWTHIPLDQNKLKCEFCERHFRVPSYLKRHTRRCHARVALPCLKYGIVNYSVDEKRQHSCKCADASTSQRCDICKQSDTITDTREKTLTSLQLNNRLQQPPPENDFSETDEHGFTCRLCNKLYSSISSLVAHKERIHGAKLAYTCNKCGAIFKAFHRLKEHQPMCLPMKSEKVCPFCNVTFKFSVNLKRHISGIHPGKTIDYTLPKQLSNTDHNCGKKIQIRTYVCHRCKFAFKNHAMLRLHITRNHMICRRGIKCGKCNLMFKSQYQLKQHFWSHLRPAERKCKLCPKIFTVKVMQTLHMNLIHNFQQEQKHVLNLMSETKSTKQRDFRENKETNEPRNDFRVGKKTKIDNGRQAMVTTKSGVNFTNLPYGTNENKSSQSKCDVCELMFATSYKLKMHKSVVHVSDRKYKCDQCEKCFKIKRHLTEHKLAHKPVDGSIRCNVCDSIFSAPHLLKRHVNRRHGEKNYRCPFEGCDQKFTEEGQLKQHIKLSKHVKANQSIVISPTTCRKPLKVGLKERFQCRFCGKETKSNSILEDHERTHLPPAFFCDLCGRGFSVMSYLKRHRKRHKEYQCHLCDKQFTMWRDLKIHLAMIHKQTPINSPAVETSNHISPHVDNLSYEGGHHRGPKVNKVARPSTEFICEKCGATYKNKTSLEAHILRHTGERPFKCDICGASFRTKSTLRGHKIHHTGQYKYICEICSLGCKNKSQLASHMRTHSGERPFPCDLCGLCFTTKGILQGHLATHSDETAYKCEVCDRGFKRKDGLDSHMVTHESPGSFPCDVCGKVYTRFNGMKQHRRSHDRPVNYHQCQICGKTFNRKDNLNVHLKIHSNQLPYVCSFCGKGFIHRCRLDKHKMTIHKGQVPSS